MPITSENFRTIAQSSLQRVILNQDAQDGLTPASLVGPEQAIQNQAVREAFREAVRNDFGEKAAGALKSHFSSSKALSSREIRDVLTEADHLSQGDPLQPQRRNTSRVLCILSQRIGEGEGAHAIGTQRLQSAAMRLVASTPGSDNVLSNATLESLADTLLQGLRDNPAQKPRGVELLNQERCPYNVEDRVKEGTLKPGMELGPYEFVRLKQKGVEPGFEARMAWKPEHTEQMRTPGHPFYQTLEVFLDNILLGQNPHEEADSRLADTINGLARAALTQRQQAPFLGDISRALRSDPDALRAVKNEILSHPFMADELTSYVKTHHPYFTTIHYVKMDYAESDRTIGHKLRIPMRTAKGMAHRDFTAKTREKANMAALKETLATDLMRAMGITTQNAHLIPSTYADGSLKLLVEAEHMNMTAEDGNILNFKDFSGHLHDGVLTREETDEDGNKTLISDPVVEHWGRNKILLLLMADRDAIGSRGDNKGRMGDTFSAIDPGHSLEGFMGFRNVHSDFSFDQPVMRNMRFKNFSMFDDSSYVEKMQGVRKMKEMREDGSDVDVFNSYADLLESEINNPQNGSELKKEFTDMRNSVLGMRDTFITRRDYILDEVFGERLPFLNAQQLPILAALDGLEKLTSPSTRLTSEGGAIRLRHLQVDKRQEWHIDSAPEGGYSFTCKGDAATVNAVQAFLAAHGIPEADIQLQKSQVILHIPQEQTEMFCAALSEENIIAERRG